MSNLTHYTTEDGKSQIQLRADPGTVWLTHYQRGLLARERGADHCVQRFSAAQRGRLCQSCPHGAKAGAAHLYFGQRRKSEEARAADAQDETDLKALENSIKSRTKP
jgi:hypothetical protein